MGVNRNIQYPNGPMKVYDPSFWKKVCLTLCIGMILHFSSLAQCANNMATRSYDTVLTGIGYGSFSIRFPKWNPDSGLLASVKISARVSVQYGFTLKNADIISSVYSLWVGREDQFSSPSMNSDYDNTTEQKIGVFPLDPGNSIVKAPFTFLDNYVNTDSITGTAPFLGTDSVSFTYSPITYTTLHTNNNSSYSYSAAARDTVHFSLTYLYCKGGGVVLAANLTRFEAGLQGPATVHLDWSSVNEVEGRQYAVQRSQDGQHFTTVAFLPAVNFSGGTDAGGSASSGAVDYNYDDHLPAGATGKWYYRLQLTDPGSSVYSVIKEVTISGGGGLSVYPNPAVDFVDLVFDQGSGAGWQVEILAADGSRIQSGNYTQSNNIHIDFLNRFPAGVYFIQATERGGQRSFIKRIVKR
jgi:hypothetical protein